MLLKAGQHGEIALIQHRAAVPLDVSGACTLLLFGSAVLRYGAPAEEKRQRADDKDVTFHGNLRAMMTLLTAGPLGQGPRDTLESQTVRINHSYALSAALLCRIVRE